jgi:glycosyltransferase involved in cell wall biosynthesis
MKDHATLVAALDRLPGVAALAVGAGSEGLPEQPNLFRLGRRDDMPAIYAACDLVVSTSAFGEGFSTALAEGMATALPAVATGVGDAAAIVGECGRIVPPRQPGALAAAVRDLLALSTAERAAVGRRARRRIVGEYSLARAVAAFDALHRGEEA